MTGRNRKRAEELARRPYPLRVYWEPDDRAWVAEIVDLPGCMAVGDCEADAIQLARDFAVDWIEEALDKQERVPEPRQEGEASGRCLARLGPSLHRRLKLAAEAERQSQNQLLVMFVSEGLAVLEGAAAVGDLLRRRLESRGVRGLLPPQGIGERPTTSLGGVSYPQDQGLSHLVGEFHGKLQMRKH